MTEQYPNDEASLWRRIGIRSVTAPVRGQRRRGTPSLVLPGDPDGCGFERERGQSSAEVPRYWLAAEWYDADEPDAVPLTVRYVGRPSRWGNPYRVVTGRSGPLGVITPDEQVVIFRTDCTAPRAAQVAVRGFRHHLDHLDRSKPPVVLARHLAPLVTADVLSCWCPLDAPCHADTLCDLVGRLRFGGLVPGLVATPDVCGGALRIDGTRTDVEWVAGAITERLGWENWSEDRAVLTIAAECSIDPELVRVAAQVGGAL